MCALAIGCCQWLEHGWEMMWAGVVVDACVYVVYMCGAGGGGEWWPYRVVTMGYVQFIML